jgi:hypothetical protein
VLLFLNACGQATTAKEISVAAGQSVCVVRTLASGWSVVVTADGATGAVPSSYVRKKE